MFEKRAVGLFLFSAIAALGLPGQAEAQVIIVSSQSHTVTGSDVRVVRSYPAAQSGQRISVIQRPIYDAALIVSREIYEQPVHPHLIEVNLVDTKVYLDPEKNIQFRDRGGRFDDNLSLVRAQRLGRALMHDGTAFIVRRPETRSMAQEHTDTVRPRMIIMKPDFIKPVPKQQKPDEAQPKQVSYDKVALAH